MNKKAFVFVLIIAAALGSACSMTNIGGIRNSREVTGQFESLEINPGYRYWYLNQENSPYGVVGLDREYRLDDDRMWQAVDPHSPTFRKVVGLVQSFPVPNSFSSGYVLTDPQGRQLGVWYSSLAAGIVVDAQTKIVSISTQMPWIFNEEF
jgi:hypothetical protein